MDDNYGLEPDSRMVHFVGGFDDAGRPIPMSPEALRRAVLAWSVTSETPDGVAGLLKTSRDLFVHGFFVYEFLTVGVLLSLQAVETGLRIRLGSTKPFARLIDDGKQSGLFDNDTRERLHAGRELRNGFSHPEQQAVWSFGMASSIISASHQLVANLFPDPTS